jgi:hypothetical protein
MRSARTLALAALLVLLPAATSRAALSLSVPGASVGTLATGTTATSPASSIQILGLPTDAWALRVDTATTGPTAGDMTRDLSTAPCDQGVDHFATPLRLTFSGALPTTTIDRPQYDLGTASAPVVAHGTTPDTVTVVYAQTVLATEAIRAGCGYSVTVRYTLAAS